MASVFLSYAREDVATAKALAKALDSASHNVWWDRHIRSGSEYSGVIEKALNDADVVVVLWSETSIRSQWVRDEAAEGRDSGRLIPVLLDESRPPMGFRQLQALDLSKWNRRGAPKRLDDLLSAIAEKVPNPGSETAAEPHEPRLGRRRVTPGIIALMAAVFIALAGFAYFATQRSTNTETPTLAVLPFADLSPTRDKAFFTEGLAEEILSLLAREPGIRIIGRSSSRLFQQGGADLRAIRDSLGVTHVLEGSARTAGEELRLSVRLIETATGTEVWAQDYHRQLNNVFMVQDEIGRAVADRLRGTLSRPTSKNKAEVTSPEVYALYLQARSKMRDRTRGPLQEAQRLASQVVAADANYAPGHALYAELTWLLSSDNYGLTAPAEAYRLAHPHASRAIELAPHAAEGHAALGLVLSGEPSRALAPLSRAVSLDPARAEVRLWLAETYSQLGRNTEAFEHYRMLPELEPLWQPSIALFTVSLVAAGEIERAQQIVDQFERRGGRPAEAAVLRGRFAEMTGDLSEAVRHVQIAARLDPQRTYTKMLLAWYYHMLGLRERGQTMAAAESIYTQLYLAGNHRALLRRLGANGQVSGGSDSDVAVATLAQARDWQSLEQLHDQWRRQGGKGCLDTNSGGVTAHRRASAMTAVNYALALKNRGRDREASALLGCLKDKITRHSGGPLRHYSLSGAIVAFTKAQILAMEGNHAGAIEAIGDAIDAGWRGWFTTRLSGYPALDPISSSPAFRELQSRIDRLIAEDRAQTLRAEAVAA